MTTSDTSGFLFRRTSLTMRLRFTPAMACSTRTRTRDSLRLTAFSRSVNWPRGGFFFRPTRLPDRRLIALEPGVLVQGGTRRIAQVFLVGEALVVDRPGTRAAEEEHTGHRGADHEDVLVGVGLLLAAVVPGLFFGVFRPLPASLRAIDDEPPGPPAFDRPPRQPA